MARAIVRVRRAKKAATAVGSLGQVVTYVLPGDHTVVGHGHVTRIAPQVEKRTIGADDARIRADSMIRPAWADFVPAAGYADLPVSYRLEAWVRVPRGG